jgi:hypothetical protein
MLWFGASQAMPVVYASKSDLMPWNIPQAPIHCPVQNILAFIVLRQPVAAKYTEHDSYSFMLQHSEVNSERYFYLLQIYITAEVRQV